MTKPAGVDVLVERAIVAVGETDGIGDRAHRRCGPVRKCQPRIAAGWR